MILNSHKIIIFNGFWLFLSIAKKFIYNGDRQIGSRYTKVIYTQFTDGSYTKEIPAPKCNGFLGPTLKGTVGDKLRIHFKNMASRPYTMHPETNLWYNDDSEGIFSITISFNFDQVFIKFIQQLNRKGKYCYLDLLWY